MAQAGRRWLEAKSRRVSAGRCDICGAATLAGDRSCDVCYLDFVGAP